MMAKAGSWTAILAVFLLGALAGAAGFAAWSPRGASSGPPPPAPAGALAVEPAGPGPAQDHSPGAEPEPVPKPKPPTRQSVLLALQSQAAGERSQAAAALRKLPAEDQRAMLAALLSEGRVLYESFDGLDQGAPPAGKGAALSLHNEWKPVAGVFGTAVRLQGAATLFGAAGGYAQLNGTDLAAAKAFSVSVWVREEKMEFDHGEYYVAFGVWPRDLRIHSMHGRVGFGMGVPELTDFGEVVQGRFALYGLTYEQGSLKVYQNGALRGTVQAGLDLEDPSTHARLGSHFWYHDGKQACARLTACYDDLRVYSRALSAHEVRVLYDAAGSAEPPAPLPEPVWPAGDVF